MNPHVFGRHFQFCSYGESHGPAYGAVIMGLPAGVPLNEGLLQKNLSRRRPGQSKLSTQRKEEDKAEILSGFFESKSLGSPIGVLVRNKDHESKDYSKIEAALNEGQVLRPGHADDLWREKFAHSDVRGGGRASGRETLTRVIAGSFAQMFLKEVLPSLNNHAFIDTLGPYCLHEEERQRALAASPEEVESYRLRFPSPKNSKAAEELLLEARSKGESWGGWITLKIANLPRGIGEPTFAKLKNEISHALMSIGAVDGVQLGHFSKDELPGTHFHSQKGSYGGIRGGMSTGEDIIFRVHFKPPSTVGSNAKEGRHDPCILPRAVPVVEAMANCVLADLVLAARLNKV